jgi:hypothetical protein
MRTRKHCSERVDIETLERRCCPAAVVISGDQTILEAGRPIVLTLSLAAPERGPVVVGYSLSGDAKANHDYRLAMSGRPLPVPEGAVTFRPGETSKLITVLPLTDALREPTERFTVHFTPLRNAELATATATITLLDDDNYTASITGPTRVIPNSLAEFTVRLSAPASKTEVIQVSTEAGSASGGTDFRPLTRLPLIFNPGESSKSFRVPVLANAAAETDETFFITAQSRDPRFPNISRRIVVIEGDGPAPPSTLSVAPTSITEGNAGSRTAWFTVSLSANTAEEVTVRYDTEDGTATVVDGDYEATTGGILTFAPGETVKSVGVTVLGDTKAESDETLGLRLSAPVNALLTTATALCTIRDDDSGPPPAAQAAWTIMVYMTGEDLNTFARDDINEMEQFLSTLPINPGVRIVVAWDQPKTGVGQSYATANGTQAAWRGYGRSVLQADSSAAIASAFDLSVGEQNTGDPAVLVDFMKWAAQQAPATNYALQLWGHGGGLAGSQFDSESGGGDALTINEFVSALGAAGVPPVQLVSYDNCLMAMAEIGYAAATRFAGHFVASEELVPGTGQNYRNAYGALNTNPTTVTSAALAAGMVASYQTQYVGQFVGQSAWDTFSAVATSGYTQLISALSQFVIATEPLATTDRTTLRGLATAAPSISLYEASFRDLGRFMARVATAGPLPQTVRAAATAVGSALTAMVSAKTADARSSSGMAIYLPTQPDAYLGSYANTASAFCSATGWDRFARWMATGNRNSKEVPSGVEQQRSSSSNSRSFGKTLAEFTSFFWATHGMADQSHGQSNEARGRGRGISRFR